MNDSPLAPDSRRSRIAIAGASGLIGSALTRSLTADGYEVVRLVRQAPRGKDELRWDPDGQRIDAGGLAGCAAVVNLAGAGVASRRWTDAYKRTIRDSRVRGTATLAEAVASLDERPRVFVNGSAIGFYGETGDRAVDESAPAGEGFLPSVCVAWEGATAAAQEAGIRTVFARTGLVVAREGGAWGKLFPLFKAGLGGRMGDGRQYWSFISVHDEVAAIRHLIDTESLSGPVNLTAPAPSPTVRSPRRWAASCTGPPSSPPRPRSCASPSARCPATSWAANASSPPASWTPASRSPSRRSRER